MENLVSKVSVYSAEIKRDWDNFKKTPKDRFTENYLSNRMKLLDSKFATCRSTHEEIVSKGTPELLEKYLNSNSFSVCEEYWLDYNTAMMDKLSAIQIRQTQLSNNHLENATLNVNLPKITIPQFDGSYNTWRAFKSMFGSLVHNNTALPNVQKLYYLKSNVSGEAAKMLQHLDNEDENYLKAWTILSDRYDHKRSLVNCQLKMLVDQPVILTESAEEIKRVIDTTTECCHSLQGLNVPVDQWDVILVFLLLRKLPMQTQSLWEEHIGATKELATLKQFKGFLEIRFRTIESVAANQTTPALPEIGHLNPTNTNSSSCRVCKQSHHVRNCPRFRNLRTEEKWTTIKREGICSNCLASSHTISNCKGSGRCLNCGQRHHTLLHHNNHAQNSTTPPGQLNSFTQRCTQSNNLHCDKKRGKNLIEMQHSSNVLLATALIKIRAPSGKECTFRGLIDPGSEATFVTEAVVQQINLKKCKNVARILGIGNAENNISHSTVSFTLGSLATRWETSVKAHVLPTLTELLPSREYSPNAWNQLEDLNLADPQFYKPEKIDILMGSDIHGMIILPGLKKGKGGTPVAQNTELGWIVSGQANDEAPKSTTILSLHQSVSLNQQLRAFWEVEEIYQGQAVSPEDEQCELHYKRHVKRNEQGRYQVQLPFKSIEPMLGASKPAAMARFLQMESKFAKNRQFYDAYKECMQEYILLGHMTRCKKRITENPHYFLPHHAVIKESSSTTKLRVVFDGSCKTSNGLSLNEQMLVGPRLQDNIFDLILQWRKFQIVFTADIEKMYRQIQIARKDRQFQLILWRDEENDIQEYSLNTVTFGTSSAPYLAVRTIHQLARDEEGNYPKAAKSLQTQLYVDDLLTGADSLEEAIDLKNQLKSTLMSGGFNLRKFTSNNKQFLRDIPPDDVETTVSVTFNDTNNSDYIKTLGIQWNPTTDDFTFKGEIKNEGVPTKRTILSDVARLYDPLGWVSPFVVTAKIMLQQLWLDNCGWDTRVSEKIEKSWVIFTNQLKDIATIRIPRWIKTNSESQLELHGFCDASERAYAAVIYARITDDSGKSSINLLASKTKVAPLKTISLPRLELCGAALLADLVKAVYKAMKFDETVPITAWTDSTITLAWITSCPSRWKTFIANRVTQIQQTIDSANWRHVESKENPADLASRGVTGIALQTSELWWKGPQFLKTTKELLERMNKSVSLTNNKANLEERRVKANLARKSERSTVEELIDKCSSYSKLIRIIGYCLKFIKNSFTKNFRHQKGNRETNLSTEELSEARYQIMKIVQGQTFFEEIQGLQKHGTIPRCSKLKSLNIALDKKGLLRVGGRLANASIPYNERHPIIIPHDHNITTIIVRHAHQQTLHGTVDQMMYYIRQTFWITNARQLVKKELHKCTKCFRLSTQQRHQLMGNLPEVRVRPARPFENSGVDYAGPIEIKAWKGKCNRIHKAYFAIFICLCTKAIHLELVSDLSTPTFIAAFRRFCSRRGICRNLYSDCGTNFVGSNNFLQKTAKEANEYWREIATNITQEGTQWHFIPPASPNFGGLWEAGVKSVKRHLRRVAGNSKMTFEELTTLLIQIEACLNSRPLCPVSNEADELAILTPAHFLIGESLIAPPMEPTTTKNITYLNRWQFIQRQLQSFWQIWRNEYMARLQQRPKWLKIQKQPTIGKIVLIRDERSPPLNWPLAKIIEVHPGSDGLIRVVTVLTQNGNFKRPMSKIAILPGQDDIEDEEKQIIVNKQII